MSTDTANCFSAGINACSAIVKSASGDVASGGPFVIKAVLFAISALILTLILKSQYDTWATSDNYSIADLLWNSVRAICVFSIVMIFINL